MDVRKEIRKQLRILALEAVLIVLSFVGLWLVITR